MMKQKSKIAKLVEAGFKINSITTQLFFEENSAKLCECSVDVHGRHYRKILGQYVKIRIKIDKTFALNYLLEIINYLKIKPN